MVVSKLITTLVTFKGVEQQINILRTIPETTSSSRRVVLGQRGRSAGDVLTLFMREVLLQLLHRTNSEIKSG